MLNVYNAKLGVDYLGVKLEEMMKLPSLQGATVVAGKRALEKEIIVVVIFRSMRYESIEKERFKAG